MDQACPLESSPTQRLPRNRRQVSLPGALSCRGCPVDLLMVERTDAPVPAWGERPVVLLAGAGISSVAPSNLLSWWHFNEAVLRGIGRHAITSYSFDDDLVAAIRRLSLDAIGVTLFSQVVYSAFAGSSWFDLLPHLDGNVPNPCHDALATLAAHGRLAAVVTTNFDTLIEQSFYDLGLVLDVQVPSPATTLADIGRDDVPRLVKVHGSASEADSLVDLASQKARGVPPHVRTWLARAFAEHPVLVLGFSGADLELGDDYLGLEAAAPTTPWLRWITTGQREPHRAARRLVDATPNGSFLTGLLPDALSDVGIEVPPPRDDPAEGSSDLTWVDDWLRGPQASKEASAATCARLLMYAGDQASADRIRRTIGESIDTEAGAVGVDEAFHAAHALALLGADQIETHPKQALIDLQRSRCITERALSAVGEKFGDEARAEQANNLGGVLVNTALAHLALDDPTAAAGTLAEIAPIADRLEPPKWLSLQASRWLVSGLTSYRDGNLRRAMISWRLATRLARRVGDTQVVLHALDHRWRTALELGEVDLARALAEEADTVGELVPGQRDSAAAKLPALRLSEETLEQLVHRLGEEVDRGGERIDEVLFTIWSIMPEISDGQRAVAASLDGLESSAVGALDPLAQALLAMARYALSESDDRLLDPVPRLLSEVAVGPAVIGAPLIELAVRLHSDLRHVVCTLGRRWAQGGVTEHARGRWDLAKVQYTVGGIALALAGESEDATRAFVYLTDGLRREGALEDARDLLARLASLAPPALTSAVVAREVGILAERADEDLPIDQACFEIEPRIERLRNLGNEEDLGSALVAAAQVWAAVGDARAKPAAYEAVRLLGDAHAGAARTLIARLESGDDRSGT